MTDQEIIAYIKKAFKEYEQELLARRSIPLLLMCAEADTDNTEVFQLCSKTVPCGEMIRCLKNAINNCRSEMLRESAQDRRN
jgi:hypothetical protein